ncbi:MAG: ferrochelatase [Bdellovibrionales bacterium]|nr:ferrochelatase [Bdellovibrionales bacterium]
MNSNEALLVLNLGTPKSTEIADVKDYLNGFLSDPYVLDTPGWIRTLLLKFVILPTRPKKTSEKYKKIWLPEGSPLLVHTIALAKKWNSLLRKPLAVAMNYGDPSLEEALKMFESKGIHDIVVMPLFPQRAYATTESIKARLKEFPQFRFDLIESFHDEDFFIAPLAQQVKSHKTESSHLIVSFHGIPIRHVKNEFPECGNCLENSECHSKGNNRCYLKQCHSTAELLAEKLRLKSDQWSIAFQSRFGSDKWTQPYILDVIEHLGKNGVKEISVVCPSFVTDGLETLEEIGIELKHTFESKFGGKLDLIPCLNDNDLWARRSAEFLKNYF